MSVKSSVLHMLEQYRGDYISGEELARQLSVSRSGVWKAIHELKKEGYTITAVTNKGYCLEADSDVLSVEGMARYLSQEVDKNRIFIHKELDSTNSEAKRLAVSGGLEHTAILAESQTGGRGRLGRTFYSPSGSGIYMSVILRPKVSVEKSVLVTTAASVAVCRAVASVTGEQCDIKWVNDIYLHGRKICGILTEAVANVETGSIESIVVGIGINFRGGDSDFPEEIRGKAGAIFPGDTGGVTRNQLAAAVLNELRSLDEALVTGSFLEEYRSRSIVLGREVQLVSAGKTVNALVLAIDDTGGLVVRYADGSEGVINTGEVSVRGLFQKE